MRLFAEARQHLGRALADMMPHIAAELARLLQEAAARGDAFDPQQLEEAAGALRQVTPELAAAVPAALEAFALRRMEWLAARQAGERPEPTLSLYDEAELGEQLALEEIASAIRLSAGAAAARLTRLVGEMLGRVLSEDSMPLGARAIAAAIVKTMHAHPALRPWWRTIRQRLPRVVPDAAARLIVDLLAFVDRARAATAAPIAEPGAAPAPPETTTAPPATAVESPAGGAARIAEDALQGGLRLGAQGVAGHADLGQRERLSMLEALRSVNDDAQAFAHRVDEEPYSRVARRRFFAELRAHLASQGTHGRAATPVVDLIGALFDYAVDDRRIPEAAKPLMWRLQMPTLMLSLLDSRYLSDDRRSVRRLVENLAAIVMAFPDEVTAGSELQRRLDTAVRAVEIVGSTLYTRASVLAEQADRALDRGAEQLALISERVGNERRALERTPDRRNRRDPLRRPGRAREREVTERLSALLEERLERHAVPESVREFLRDIWLRHLRTAVLRDGEDSPEYRVALQVVDDLLWTLNGGAQRQSRRELVERIPPLIRTLTQGIHAVGASSSEFKAFFDELFLIHLRKLQRRGEGTQEPADRPVGPRAEPRLGPLPGEGRGVSPVGEPARASEPVPRAEPAPAAEPAPDDGARSGSERRLLQVLASLDLGDFPVDFERRALEPDEALQRIDRGDWIELRSRDGASTFAKVAWINSRRTVVLLVRMPDRKALSLRSTELRSRFAQRRAFLLGFRRPGR